MSPHGTQHTFPLPKTTHRNGGWRLGPPTPHTPTATQRHSKSTQRGPGSTPEGSGGCSRGLGAPAKMLKEKAPESPMGEEGTPTPPLSKPQSWGGQRGAAGDWGAQGLLGALPSVFGGCTLLPWGGQGHVTRVAEGTWMCQGAVHQLHPSGGSVHGTGGTRKDTPFPSTANSSQENSKPTGEAPSCKPGERDHASPRRGEGRVKLWGAGGAPPHRCRHPAPTSSPLWQRARKERWGTAPHVRHSEPLAPHRGGEEQQAPTWLSSGGWILGSQAPHGARSQDPDRQQHTEEVTGQPDTGEGTDMEDEPPHLPNPPPAGHKHP